MVANLFIRKIYKQHFQCIKQLTIPMPLFISDCIHPWRTNRRRYNDIVPELLTSNWEDKDFDYAEAWTHLVRDLKRMHCLRQLTLVLPRNLDPFIACKTNDEICDAFDSLIKVKPEMAMVVVRIQPDWYRNDGDTRTEVEMWTREGCPATHARIVRLLKNAVQEFIIKAAVEHKRICWRIVDDVPEAALLPPAEAEDAE